MGMKLEYLYRHNFDGISYWELLRCRLEFWVCIAVGLLGYNHDVCKNVHNPYPKEFH